MMHGELITSVRGSLNKDSKDILTTDGKMHFLSRDESGASSSVAGDLRNPSHDTELYFVTKVLKERNFKRN